MQATLGSDAQPAFCSTCHEVSGGNPFLLGELTAALEHDGVAGRASDAPLVRELALEGVARATLLRLARLPPAAARLARAVAVLGDGADGRHIAALSGLGRHELDEAADALGRAGILEARLPLRFVHPLVRNAIYSDVPAAERDRAHRAAADLLAAEGVAPERVALHLLATEPQAIPRWSRFCQRRRAGRSPAPRRSRRSPTFGVRCVSRRRRRCGWTYSSCSSPPRGAPAASLLLDGLEWDPVGELGGDPDYLVRSALELARLLMATGRLGELSRCSSARSRRARRRGTWTWRFS